MKGFLSQPVEGCWYLDDVDLSPAEPAVSLQAAIVKAGTLQ